MLEGATMARLTASFVGESAAEMAQRRLLAPAPGDMGDDKRASCRSRQLAASLDPSSLRIIENNNSCNREAALQHMAQFANQNLDNQQSRIKSSSTLSVAKTEITTKSQRLVKQTTSIKRTPTSSCSPLGQHQRIPKPQEASQLIARRTLRPKPFIAASSVPTSIGDKRGPASKAPSLICRASASTASVARPLQILDPFERRAEASIVGLTARLKLRAGRQQPSKLAQATRTTKDPLGPIAAASPAVTNSRLRQGLLYARRHQSGLAGSSLTATSRASVSLPFRNTAGLSPRRTASQSQVSRRQVGASLADISITERASSSLLSSCQSSASKQQRYKANRQPSMSHHPGGQYQQQQAAGLGRTLSRFSLASSNSSLHTLSLVSVKRAKAEQQQQVGQPSLWIGAPRSSSSDSHAHRVHSTASCTASGRQIRGPRSRRLQAAGKTLAAASLPARVPKTALAVALKEGDSAVSAVEPIAAPIGAHGASCSLTQNATSSANINVYLTASGTGALPNVEKTAVTSSLQTSVSDQQHRLQPPQMATLVLSPILTMGSNNIENNTIGTLNNSQNTENDCLVAGESNQCNEQQDANKRPIPKDTATNNPDQNNPTIALEPRALARNQEPTIEQTEAQEQENKPVVTNGFVSLATQEIVANAVMPKQAAGKILSPSNRQLQPSDELPADSSEFQRQDSRMLLIDNLISTISQQSPCDRENDENCNSLTSQETTNKRRLSMVANGVVAKVSPQQINHHQQQCRPLKTPIAPKLPDIPIKTESINDYYDLEARPFARGKFAQVKKCVARSTKQCFAAKCIKKRRRSLDMRNDILLEIEALKLSYQSSRIIKLYEVFETSSEIIFVLELAIGGELQRVIDEGELIPEALVKKMVRQILEGLIQLHDSNIAHLDIKPQNLLLTEAYPNGDIKLCDFGISRRINKDCEIREICGTPDYVAPEILGYDPISLATDMWSLGILTYVLLSGYSPFAGETKQETYCNITQAELEFPREIFETTSMDAIDFVRKLLVREPTERLTSREARNHVWLFS